MDGKREKNFELLRVISTFSVVTHHVGATYFAAAFHKIAAGLSITEIQSSVMICVYYSIFRYSLPCFLMLSGAFILDNQKNANYRQFYSKSFAKIGVPLIVFTVLYILYRIPLCFVGEGKGISPLLYDIMIGSPMYHMWYVYMLIGIYLLAPIVLRFKDSISEETFYKVSFVFLIWASLSRWTTGRVQLNWDIGQSFEYLGFFMVGYSIRKMNQNKKNNRKALLLLFAGIGSQLGIAGLEYVVLSRAIAENTLKYQIIASYSPLVVIASLLTFYGFALLDAKKSVKRISDIIFYVYLFHAGVWDVIVKLSQILKGEDFLTGLNATVWIPIFGIFVFVISCILSEIYIRLWKKIDKDNKVTERLLRMVHLAKKGEEAAFARITTKQ